MTNNKDKKTNELIFGKKSSKLAIWISLFYSGGLLYLYFGLGYTEYSSEQIIIGLLIFLFIFILSTFYESNHVGVDQSGISIMNSINDKKRVQVSFDQIQKIEFYLPNDGEGESALFNIRIKIKGQMKRIQKTIGLSKKEIRSLAEILEEKGIEVKCDALIKYESKNNKS